MSDAPIVGKFGEEPQEIDEASLIFSAGPRAYDEDEDGPAPPPPPPRHRGLMIAAAVVALAGVSFFAYQRSQAPSVSDTPPELPPMVPSQMVSGGVSEAIVPVPSAIVRGPVGSTARIGVRAAGRAGLAIADTLVQFVVESGNGVLATNSARTTIDGIATTSITLPTRPGITVVLASIHGSEIAAGRITVTALPGTPEQISIISGNNQAADIGELLPTRLFVFVSDGAGNPVPDADVRFRVVSGDGLTAPSQTRTDSLGQASALWRLGMTPGEQSLAASASAFGGETAFRAVARARDQVGLNEPAPIETNEVTVVSATFAIGGSHVCELDGDRLLCRGGNDRGQTATQGPTRFVAISAGVSHVCGLSPDGMASCWGANDAGQLGDGVKSDRSSPVTVRTELRFSSLVAGAGHTCGLAGGGIPICWGLNLSGQLGDGSRNDHNVPRTVGGGLAFRRLTAGWNHTCGLTANGNAFCWGLNSQGQLGDGSRLDRLVPTLVRGAVETLVAGSAHSCGISEEKVLCWGGNSFGQLGDGSAEDRSQPVEVQGLPGAPTHLAAGAVHACALVSGGRAYCWGQNLQGQLGDGTTQNRASAVAVSGEMTFSDIYAGGALTCATATDGRLFCWGLNQSGQVGDGTRVSRSVPTRVIR